MSLIPPTARAVVFDAVGTLIFPIPGAPTVYTQYATRHGGAQDEDTIRNRMIAAYSGEEEIDRETGWLTSEDREIERWRRIVRASLVDVPDPDACFRELYEHFARPGAWVVNEDAAAVLAGLAARGMTLGLASNYDSRLRQVLDGFPVLKPLRERVLISSELGHRKPSRRFFDLVVRACGLDKPADVVYVGDDVENDYRGAVDAGLTAVLLDDRGRFPGYESVRRLTDLFG